MQISGLNASGSFSATDILAIEVNVNGVEKTYKLTGATLAAALASIGSYLKTTDVVNSLTSTSTTTPLSANMGKTLNDNITAINSNITAINSKINYFKFVLLANVQFDTSFQESFRQVFVDLGKPTGIITGNVWGSTGYVAIVSTDYAGEFMVTALAVNLGVLQVFVISADGATISNYRSIQLT